MENRDQVYQYPDSILAFLPSLRFDCFASSPKQNYAIVAALNTLALALALPGGLISPTVTALLSNGSAILATINGMRPVLRYQ
jgi:hypothetical protein